MDQLNNKFKCQRKEVSIDFHKFKWTWKCTFKENSSILCPYW